tara:strand:- start:1836 stop:2417 length:582 start_codon:yes stop_codon:yes gene_type:complete
MMFFDNYLPNKIIARVVFWGMMGGVGMANGDVTIVETLKRIQANQTWGEVELESGSVRVFKVMEISEEKVKVQEIVSALQERSAIYSIKEFKAIRELGKNRIAMRSSNYRSSRSRIGALAVETLVPGGGYFYVGESRQGISMVMFTAAAAATWLITGKDGFVGWIPLAAWTKIASLLHLNDEVVAINNLQDTN